MVTVIDCNRHITSHPISMAVFLTPCALRPGMIPGLRTHLTGSFSCLAGKNDLFARVFLVQPENPEFGVSYL